MVKRQTVKCKRQSVEYDRYFSGNLESTSSLVSYLSVAKISQFTNGENLNVNTHLSI